MAEQKPDMTGKVCIVTGATSGIGEKTAIPLIQKFGSLDVLYARLDEVP